MTRDSSQNHFYKIFEFLIDKSSSFAHKNMSIFYFNDDQAWGIISVLTISCYATFYGSSVPNFHTSRPETLLTLRGTIY